MRAPLRRSPSGGALGTRSFCSFGCFIVLAVVVGVVC